MQGKVILSDGPLAIRIPRIQLHRSDNPSFRPRLNHVFHLSYGRPSSRIGPFDSIIPLGPYAIAEHYYRHIPKVLLCLECSVGTVPALAQGSCAIAEHYYRHRPKILDSSVETVPALAQGSCVIAKHCYRHPPKVLVSLEPSVDIVPAPRVVPRPRCSSRRSPRLWQPRARAVCAEVFSPYRSSRPPAPGAIGPRQRFRRSATHLRRVGLLDRSVEQFRKWFLWRKGQGGARKWGTSPSSSMWELWMGVEGG
ncbi:hypothetical protein DFH08DRAFT_874993 [Mycena albidolilacea]|uniref:Uncharacterized protein n=1 Tax=Mycena albidolilacea TaxID=1033008 RepID=A0AAD7EPH0_9AGAR|nr:hypothetical protein DFH08DRAFT_874993 [Mycena albidolilacea]